MGLLAISLFQEGFLGLVQATLAKEVRQQLTMRGPTAAYIDTSTSQTYLDWEPHATSELPTTLLIVTLVTGATYVRPAGETVSGVPGPATSSY